jgi:hypothetical protein
MSFGKNFSITERTALELRLDMFNAMNHVNWGNPNTDTLSSGASPAPVRAAACSSSCGSPSDRKHRSGLCGTEPEPAPATPAGTPLTVPWQA